MSNKPILEELLTALNLKRREPVQDEVPSLVVRITGDVNDADYRTDEHEIPLGTEAGIEEARTFIGTIRNADDVFADQTCNLDPQPEWRKMLEDNYCLPGDEYFDYHTITGMDFFIRCDGVLYPIEFPEKA